MDVLKDEAQAPSGEKKTSRVYSFSGTPNAGYSQGNNSGNQI